MMGDEDQRPDETVVVGGPSGPPTGGPPTARPPSGTSPAEPGAPVGAPGGPSLPPPPPPNAGPGSSGGGSGRSPLLVLGVLAVVVAVVVAVVMLRSGGDEISESTTTPPSVTEPETIEPETTGPDTDPSAPTSPPVTTEPTSATEPPTADVPPSVDDLSRAVVQIRLLLGDQTVCTGSGTIVGADGTILTNSHVITQDSFCPHDRIGVAVLDVPELPPLLLFEADVLVDDPALDLAVIRIARTLDGGAITGDFPTVEVGDSDQLSLGDRLRVIGYPGIGGETVTFTEGTISGFVTVPGLGERSWLKTDATIAGGNSGGLAIDDAGLLVGIPTIVGTGGGRIVDCRFIEDTNMDGRIDADDACVPVGGFINGIRPVNLAIPLLDAAVTATPMERRPPPVDTPVDAAALPGASEPVWTFDVVDGLPTAPTAVVPPGTPQLCLTWQYSSVPTGTPFEIAWFLDGTFDPGPSVTGTNQGADSGGFFACVSNPDGLIPGLYEMAWLVDDQPVFLQAIHVGGERSLATVLLVNETPTPICLVQIAPTEAVSFGLNLLSTPIPPGGSRAFPVATGRYDRRIIDCDGTVFVEDAEGIDITGDLTLTLSLG